MLQVKCPLCAAIPFFFFSASPSCFLDPTLTLFFFVFPSFLFPFLFPSPYITLSFSFSLYYAFLFSVPH